MELTPQEKYMLEIVRELKPFETITITKDQTGKPNHFLVNRSQKIILSEIVLAVKI